MIGPCGAILDRIIASQDVLQELDETLNHDLHSCKISVVMQELYDVRDLVEDRAQALEPLFGSEVLPTVVG